MNTGAAASATGPKLIPLRAGGNCEVVDMWLVALLVMARLLQSDFFLFPFCTFASLEIAVFQLSLLFTCSMSGYAGATSWNAALSINWRVLGHTFNVSETRRYSRLILAEKGFEC